MILFLTLKVFSATGGIEKVCRVAGKALYEYGLEKNKPVKIYAMHGPKGIASGNKYFPAEIFRSFGKARFRYVKDAVLAGRESETVIMSHINLLVVGWLIKKLKPSVNLVLIAHGIEVWKPLSFYKRHMLKACDKIVSVSHFTEDRVRELHSVPVKKSSVLNNCIDPFLVKPEKKVKDPSLMKRYGLADDDIVLFTLTRLSEKDRYKGYDRVLRSMAELIKEEGTAAAKVKYLLAGSYEEAEKQFIDQLIDELQLEGRVILSGFVADEELPAHFSLADIYIMPSVKEGFGIVFVEAMYYDLPVIAGNADGSSDALLNGKLGLLIDPYNPAEIKAAVMKMISKREQYKPDHDLLMKHFSYEVYKQELEKIIA